MGCIVFRLIYDNYFLKSICYEFGRPSLDPIFSHGLGVALVSGRDAAQAVVAAMDGNSAPMDNYAETLHKMLLYYNTER